MANGTPAYQFGDNRKKRMAGVAPVAPPRPIAPAASLRFGMGMSPEEMNSATSQPLVETRRLDPAEEWRKVGGIRGIVPTLARGAMDVSAESTPFGRAVWTGDASRVSAPQVTPQPVATPGTPGAAGLPHAVAGVGSPMVPSVGVMPAPATPAPTGPLKALAPRKRTGIIINGQEWNPGDDTGVIFNPNAPSSRPAEMSPGGGRLITTNSVSDSPASQPGFRGQTLSDLGPTARQRVSALSEKQSANRGPRASLPERLLAAEGQNAVGVVNAQGANQANLAGIAGRNALDLQAPALANAERVAGLGVRASSDSKEADRQNALEVARLRGPAGAAGVAKESGDQMEQAAAIVGQIAELDATSPSINPFSKAPGSGQLAAQRAGLVAQLRALGYDEQGNPIEGTTPEAGASRASKGPKLTPEQAKAILQEAGGDKAKARQIAIQRGFNLAA